MDLLRYQLWYDILFIIIIFFIYLASKHSLSLPTALRLEGKGRILFYIFLEDKCFDLTCFSDNLDFNYPTSKTFTIIKRSE